MFKNKSFFYLLIGLLVVLGASTLIVLQKDNTSPQANLNDLLETEILQQQVKASLIIELPDGQAESFDSKITGEITAFDLFEQNDIAVEYKKYDFGNFITSILGVENGKDEKYWVYYVNGELANVGADSYILQPGDKIKWRFEEMKEGL